ncbi:5'-3' exonuclease [Arsukibacterium sp. MJ3]|uniref:flap endonuclease Xni n=1 Tax=Arsukibacterium sp. MJ3 TaxID=1632859 RepID=UPI0006273354|nr:flap endonuclease Xni [Arsukibacterium sp. MJ3]KKO50132.1 5'-3' exonuclease [Arsukibacterium sp. MJ3]
MMHLLLIDALNVIRRLYAVQERPYLPLPEQLTDGTQQQIINNTETMLLQALQRLRQELLPSHALLVFDGRDSQWRQQRCPEYKANRKPMPVILAQALPALKQRLQQHGFQCFTDEKIEADDVIASIATKISQHQQQATIVSTDKGFLPLLNQGVAIYDPFARQQLTNEYVQNKFGVVPEQLVRLWSLTGDSTNNIAGVAGVGPKTALELMALGDTLTDALAHADCPKKLRDKILSQKEAIMNYMQVLSLQTNLELGLNLQELRLADVRGEPQ